MGNYVIAATTESDENGPKELGCINGGFSNKRLPDANAHPSFVIAVDDIKESIKKITNAGGKKFLVSQWTFLVSGCPLGLLIPRAIA